MGWTKAILEKQNNDLKIQRDNLRAKLELLQSEYKVETESLKKVTSMLQAEIKALTQKLEEANDLRIETMQERIDLAVSKAVAQATAPLVEELTKAHIEIDRLKAIINKDSSNSSKPPSSNGFKDVPNSREKSGRSRGGQKGHPGHRLALPENMDEYIEQGLMTKKLIDHTNGNSDYISRFVIDVEVITTVTEHRYAKGTRLPENLYNEVSYGDNIKTMSVLLLKEGIVAEKRLSEIISGLTHGIVTISPATMESFLSQFSISLDKNGEIDAIEEDLLNGYVMNTDDTPIRSTETIVYPEEGEPYTKQSEKKTFKVTLRTHSNDRSTLFTANPQKNKEGVDRDNILPRYMGILSHDHESKFYNYGKAHATCGDHLCRDLKGLHDLQKIPWAEKMRKFVLGMNTHKKKDLAKDKSKCDDAILAGYEKKFDELIEQGRAEHGRMKENELGYTEFNAMLNRLRDYKDCYMLFMRDYKVPFTNNLAERDLRSEKVKEKVSLQFRSWKGIVRHTKIRSFISTVKKRKLDLFSSISSVFQNAPVLR